MKQFVYFILFFIVSCTNAPYDLGYGYSLTRNSRNDLAIINADNSYIVYGHILKYSFDSTFVLVVEKPRDSILECSGTVPKMTKRKCDEAFEKSTFKQYWIINKTEESNYSYDSIRKVAIYSNVYGPYKKEEYFKKRKELGVSDNLVMD
jgi:hypothetical protein